MSRKENVVSIRLGDDSYKTWKTAIDYIRKEKENRSLGIKISEVMILENLMVNWAMDILKRKEEKQ
jgi:hypothetical protein